jgi:phytol kinase
MLKAAFSLVLIFIVLVLAEYLFRGHKIKNEDSRKLIHIFVASFVATWPFYMTYHYIELISLAFFVVIVLSRYLKVFQSIHKVGRKSMGDILFPISILISALLAPSRLVFVVVMLNIGLADGLAAIVGVRLGKHTKKAKFGHTKSFAGSLTFFIVALAILLFIKVFPIHLNHLGWPMVAILPLATALIENLSGYGSDNITVPLAILVALRWL